MQKIEDFSNVSQALATMYYTVFIIQYSKKSKSSKSSTFSVNSTIRASPLESEYK